MQINVSLFSLIIFDTGRVKRSSEEGREASYSNRVNSRSSWGRKNNPSPKTSDKLEHHKDITFKLDD